MGANGGSYSRRGGDRRSAAGACKGRGRPPAGGFLTTGVAEQGEGANKRRSAAVPSGTASRPAPNPFSAAGADLPRGSGSCPRLFSCFQGFYGASARRSKASPAGAKVRAALAPRRVPARRDDGPATLPALSSSVLTPPSSPRAPGMEYSRGQPAHWHPWHPCVHSSPSAQLECRRRGLRALGRCSRGRSHPPSPRGGWHRPALRLISVHGISTQGAGHARRCSILPLPLRRHSRPVDGGRPLVGRWGDDPSAANLGHWFRLLHPPGSTPCTAGCAALHSPPPLAALPPLLALLRRVDQAELVAVCAAQHADGTRLCRDEACRRQAAGAACAPPCFATL